MDLIGKDTHFGESVFGDDDDDDDVKKNELKTRGGCSFSSNKTGDRKECRIVASSNARRRQTDRISKTKKDIISLDPHKQTTTTTTTEDDDDDKQSRNGTTNRKEEKSHHHPPDTHNDATTKTDRNDDVKARTFLGGETTTCAQEEANILDDVCASVMWMCLFLSLLFVLCGGLRKSLGFKTLSLTEKRIILILRT